MTEWTGSSTTSATENFDSNHPDANNEHSNSGSYSLKLLSNSSSKTIYSNSTDTKGKTVSHTFWVYGNSGETFTTEDFTIVYDGGTQTNTETTIHTLSLTGWNVVIHEYAVPDNVTSYQFRIKANSTTIWVDDYEANINDFAVSSAELDVLSFTDYYAFGMAMEGRISQNDEYRYGFQGQEKEDELKGNGNVYAYTYRFHDARLGRFFSVDPLAVYYPHNSQYAFAENRVIDGVDLEGREFSFTLFNALDLTVQSSYVQIKLEDGTEIEYNLISANESLQNLLTLATGFAKLSRGVENSSPAGQYTQTVMLLHQMDIDVDKVSNGEMKLQEFLDKYEILKPADAKTGEGMYDLLRRAFVDHDLEAIGEVIGFATQMGVGASAGRAAEKIATKEIKKTPVEKSPSTKTKSLKSGSLESSKIKAQPKTLESGAQQFGCFVAGTLVKTSEGDKLIEEVKPDDLVWSFNEQTGETELKRVYNPYSRDSITVLYNVLIENELIQVTDEHPFYINNEWVKAKDLQVGDSVYLFTNDLKLAIKHLERIDTLVKVYNFTVEDNHNYYVTKLGVLVHNNCIRNAVESIKKGKLKVTVANREQAGSVFRELYVGGKNAIKSSDGLTSTGAKKYFNKESYYHWDTEWVWNEEYGGYHLKNHNPFTDADAFKPHLQIHDKATGKVYKIFFEGDPMPTTPSAKKN